MKKNKIYEYKTIRSQGALLHLFKEKGAESWKFHNWDGPAIEPMEGGCELKKQYYLYGTLYDFHDWNDIKSQREGIPYYKNQSIKNLLDDYRN